MALVDSLTLGDLADIEDVAGVSLNGMDLDNPSMKVALAFVWIVKRRADPTFTYEKARNLSASELGNLQATLEANPTVAPQPGQEKPPGEAIGADGAA
jgi:hypothetical protein